MAGHDLIDGYLVELAQQLPSEAVDELADGLEEAYRSHTDSGLEPDAAATMATAEFGRPEQVVEAFARHSAGRRTALALLATGPLFAMAWSTSLVTGNAWTWSVPPGVAVAFGLTLLAAAGALVVAATGRSYRRTRLAGPACAVLVLLDAAMIGAVGLVAPALTWPMGFAVAASLARIGFACRSVPRIVLH